MSRITAKDKLIEAALALIPEQGFPATTVDQICERASVSKGSFYHYFESKEDLGLETLRVYYANGTTLLMDGAFASEADPAKRADGFLTHTEALAADHWKQGCLLATFVVDMAESHPRIRAEVVRLFDDIITNLAPMFQALLPVSCPVTPLQVAEHYIATLEGSIVLARAYNDPERIPAALRQFRCYLDGLKYA